MHTPAPAPSLALFYSRAKQTFFTPNAEYELNVPSDILTPFHTSSPTSSWSSHGPRKNVLPTAAALAHPDPAVFAEVACEVQSMLKDSLARFVRASYTNVGSRRGLCGIVGGSFIAICTGVIPLLDTAVVNQYTQPRWVRFVAWPGLWLGLTILIASLHGVCLMVYVFGDVRQLRKFELSRPPISPPQPLTAPRKRERSKGRRNSKEREKDIEARVPRVKPLTRPPKVVFPPAHATRAHGIAARQLEVGLELRTADGSASAASLEAVDALPVIAALSKVECQASTSPMLPLPAPVHSPRTPQSLPKIIIQQPSPSLPVASSSSSPIAVAPSVSPLEIHTRPRRHAHTPSRTSHSSHTSDSASSASDDDSTSDIDDFSSCDSYECDDDPAARRAAIHISPAYFDPEPLPEGPATAPSFFHSSGRGVQTGIVWDEGKEKAQGEREWYDYGENGPFGLTAPFIRPHRYRESRYRRSGGIDGDGDGADSSSWASSSDEFYYRSDGRKGGGGNRSRRELRRRVEEESLTEFDFDLLPRRGYTFPARPEVGRDGAGHGEAVKEKEKVQATDKAQDSLKESPKDAPPVDSAFAFTPRAVLARAQYKCNRKVYTPSLTTATSPTAYSPTSPGSVARFPFSTTSHTPYHPTTQPSNPSQSPTQPPSDKENTLSYRARLALIRAVPAFAAPLTRVLEPVVTRAQWEIVVRSAAIAALISGTVIGLVVGVVPGRD